MLKNPDSPVKAFAAAAWAGARQPQVAQARHMRLHLADFLARMLAGTQELRLPSPAGAWVARGDGHFHLAPELFLQVSGWTQFRFPHAELLLGPGQALILPPKLLHAERIGGADGTPFSNIVVYAEEGALTCHLAHQDEAGRPGILHLEARQHVQAQRVQQWLADAARLACPADAGQGERALAAAQARALLMAATAGVLRALDDDAAAALRPEPPLVPLARALIQNQLGDQALSVRRLAEQAGCTADYLSHLFSEATGEHLAAYINRQRMERAAHLLSVSALAGKEAAWACGFASQSYFIRNFRAHFGMTPKMWQAARKPAQG